MLAGPRAISKRSCAISRRPRGSASEGGAAAARGADRPDGIAGGFRHDAGPRPRGEPGAPCGVRRRGARRYRERPPARPAVDADAIESAAARRAASKREQTHDRSGPPHRQARPRNQDARAAGLPRDDRAGRDRHPPALRRRRGLHLRPGLHLDRLLRELDHLHRRRGGRAALPRLPDRAAGREVALPRGRLPAALRRVADRGPARGLREPRHQPHHAARADGLLLPRLPARRAPDGGGLRHDGRDVGLLPRLDRHHRRLAARGRDDPDDRQDADDRRLGLQVLGRPAVRLPEEQPRLRLELPQHVLRGAGERLRRRSDPLDGDGPDLHAARRPRAERLDLDGAARLLLGRQPLRLHRRRRRLPLGARAWRRQRGVPADAARDRHRRPHPRVHQRAPRTRTTRSG